MPKLISTLSGWCHRHRLAGDANLLCTRSRFRAQPSLACACQLVGLAAAGSAAIALALLSGCGTRAVALLLAWPLAANLLAARGEVVLFILGSIGGVGALALLGPGAYSIDAHRFGRRVIRLEPRPLDRGGPG